MNATGPMFRRLVVAATAAAVLCCAVPGCRKAEPEPKPVVATVNGERIDAEEFDSRYRREAASAQMVPPGRPEEMRLFKEEILNLLIQEKLMDMRARDLRLSVSDEEFAKRLDEIRREYPADSFEAMLKQEKVDFEAWKKGLRQRMLMEKLVRREVNDRVSLTPRDVKTFYERNKAAYVHEKRVRVAQIVLRKRYLAEDVRRRLKKGEDFAKVAQEVSIAPEAARGGDLGFFAKGMMPEEIDAAIFSLPVGGLSRVIKSPYGYHIFKVLERDEGGSGKAWDMDETVRADAQRWKEEQAYADWLRGLRAKAQIRIFRDVLFGERAPAGEEKS
ncbi:MAG: Foldase protein PrsA precursor [Syntrophaceae bacterium PtaU1.Bin231]|nr:MAG: Foldase protein PrsA precursor [Syntrophaceae bacterium PtaU1.Bin231]HOG16985.1 peptidylprolyl isomerase [Syntrophales bacterium]